MFPRLALAVTVLTLVVVAGVFGKRSDANTLEALGRLLVSKARAHVPDHSPLAGPVAALKPSDHFPLEEKVRARIHSDKQMAGSQIVVAAGAKPGEIWLRGSVPTLIAKLRALQLANDTVGVELVAAEELAVR